VNGLGFLRWLSQLYLHCTSPLSLWLKVIWFSAVFFSEILKDFMAKCQCLTLSLTCSVSSCRDPPAWQEVHLKGQARDVDPTFTRKGCEMWGHGASPQPESLPQVLVRRRAKNIISKSYWYSPFHNLPLFTVSRVRWHNLTLKLHGHKPPLCWKMHYPHSQVHRHVLSAAARNDQHCLPCPKRQMNFC